MSKVQVQSVKLVKTFSESDLTVQMLLNDTVIGECSTEEEGAGEHFYETMERMAKNLARFFKVPLEEVVTEVPGESGE